MNEESCRKCGFSASLHVAGACMPGVRLKSINDARRTLATMQASVDAFKRLALVSGCAAFAEFATLMGDYVGRCREAMSVGIDVTLPGSLPALDAGDRDRLLRIMGLIYGEAVKNLSFDQDSQ